MTVPLAPPDARAPARRRLILLLQVVISAAALFLVIRQVSGEKLLLVLARSRPLPLALALGCVVLDRVLMAAKWRILLQAQGLARPLGDLIRIYFTGTFYGSFLPTGVGGDVIRVVQVARGRNDIGAASASVVMERALGLLALAALVAVCLTVFVLRERADLLPLLGLALLALVLGGAGLAWMLYARLPGPLSRFASRLPKRLSRFAETFRIYAGARRALAAFFALSLVEHLVPVAANYAMGRALGLDLSFATFLLIIPIILFVVRIPISLDGLGLQESLYVSLFSRAGVGTSESFLLAVVGRLVTLLGVLPGAFFKARGARAPAQIESV